jgi:non-ribosomal peptide synthetase component F
LLEGIAVTVPEDMSFVDAQRYLQLNANEHKKFWLNYVSQIEERNELIGIQNLAKMKGIRLSNYKNVIDQVTILFSIDGVKYKKLKAMCQNNGYTINTILQFIWHRILYVYGNHHQTVVGTVVSGRDLPIDGIENSIGLYINTLPLMFDHSIERSVEEALQILQQDIVDINNCSNVKLSELSKGGTRLFDTLFIYENYPEVSKGKKNLNIQFEQTYEKVDYPFVILAMEKSNSVYLGLTYARELFEELTIKYLVDCFLTLADCVSENPSLPLRNLSALGKSEYEKIIQRWNDTDEHFERSTIQALFEEQVCKSGDNVAVFYENNILTYNQLNEFSNQLARLIRNTISVNESTLICICFDRSELSIVAILAVLKSGAAYVPIDPTATDDRIRHILFDTKAELLLCQTSSLNRLIQICKVRTIPIDSPETKEKLCSIPAKNLNIKRTGKGCNVRAQRGCQPVRLLNEPIRIP